jgi:hypothetical protein
MSTKLLGALLLLLWSIKLSAIGDPYVAGTINGPTSACIGTTATYTVVGSSATSGYTWSVSSGVQINSGLGTNQINVIFTSPGEKIISVSGNGLSASITVMIYVPPSGTPVINGPSSICAGGTSTYYVTGVGNATYYSWGATNGATIISGQGTATVTIAFPSTYTTGVVVITPVSGPCGGGTTTQKSISSGGTGTLPEMPGVIAGQVAICPSSTESYSITPVLGVSSYVWTVPSGLTITSGQGTTSINVSISSTPSVGNITVSGSNCMGNGPARILEISLKAVPPLPGGINGNKFVCAGSLGNEYWIDPIPGATGYTWYAASGATVVSGQNTTKVKVDFGSTFTGSLISVRGVNCAGSGPITALTFSSENEVGGRGPAPNVDLVTGTMSASIPLFTCSDGDLSIPTSLVYMANGVRVTDDDGYVGHNWSISSTNFRISREVRGLPDDFYGSGTDARRGWLYGTKRTTIKNFTPTSDGNVSTCADEVTDFNFLNAFTYNDDTEPDVYHVSGPNILFDFYFDENRNPQLLPYQDVAIKAYTSAGLFTSSTTSGNLISFTVIDNAGIQYNFSTVESITETIQETNNYYLARYSKQRGTSMTYNTNWRLTSVSGPTYGTVTFSYKTVNSGDNNLTSEFLKKHPQYKFKFPNDFDYSGGTYKMAFTRTHVLKMLEKISSPSMEAVFASTAKNTETTLERLNYINIFEKRTTSPVLVKKITFNYSSVDILGDPSVEPLNYRSRTYLTSVVAGTTCFEQKHLFEYYNTPLPKFGSKNKDEWDFYYTYDKYVSSPEVKLPYDETVNRGSLKRIIYPSKGYDVFFYEPHTYWVGTEQKLGGGLRLKKMISHDGISTANNIIREFEYVNGKLQFEAFHKFDVTVLHRHATQFATTIPARFLQIKGSSTTDPNFQVTSDDELGSPSMYNGSVVAYNRVIVKTPGSGKIQYEFDLPASVGEYTANNGEWNAASVKLARPSTGGSNCFETHNVKLGWGAYPFPPNPDYSFAKGLLLSEAAFNETGTQVSNTTYNYQRVYANGTGIIKVYGLALEELPTYYKNGTSYVDNKMFAFSKYERFAGVRTEISSKTEVVYHSPDLQSFVAKTTEYQYSSPNHRELTKVIVTNSDGTTSATAYKYAKDFTITTPSGVPATAINNLKTANRNVLVERLLTHISGGVARYTGASITHYQTISGKVYPYQSYEYIAAAPTTGFVPAYVSSGALVIDPKYGLQTTYNAFDSNGKATEIIANDRTVTSILSGYNGTVAIVEANHSKNSQLRYSDFDVSTGTPFYVTWGTPTYSTGRNGTKALNLSAGNENTNMLTTSLSNENIPTFIFSCWIKSSTAGNLSVLVGASTTSTVQTPIAASEDYRYYHLKVPVDAVVAGSSGFYIRVWSSVNIQIDEMAFYPIDAQLTTYTYEFPNGKKCETDSFGRSRYFEYDPWGRLFAIYDQDRNVLAVYDYKVKL